MSLFSISDLHLSLNTDKSMEVFGDNWLNYVDKIKFNFEKNINPNDTIVIPGDISWAMTTEESLLDFEFINSLNGKKIILKGNHDYWFTTKSKINDFFNKNGISSVEILHNNYYNYENFAICGTKGYDITKKPITSHELKIENRECERLRLSLSKAVADGFSDFIVFIHYPPIIKYGKYNDNPIFNILKEFNVKKCFYGHMHNKAHHVAITNEYQEIDFKLISADYLNFCPLKII